MAIYCGVIVGGFGGYVADAPDLGWRFAFDACGVFGMLYALPLVLLLRDAPQVGRRRRGADDVSPLRAAAELLTNVSFILLVLYFTLPALAGWVVRDWMPAILKEQFDIGQGQAGVAATLYWQAAAIVGAVVGGWLADRWMRRTERGRIYVSAIGMCLIVPAIFGVGNAGTLAVAVAFLIAVRPRLGLLRLQQHADPVPDRPAGAAGDRLRHHEPREHQLRRARRLGLRRCCATGTCRSTYLRRVRQPRRHCGRVDADDPAEARGRVGCLTCHWSHGRPNTTFVFRPSALSTNTVRLYTYIPRGHARTATPRPAPGPPRPHPRPSRGRRIGAREAGRSTGFPALDRLLAGRGLRAGSLVEWRNTADGSGAMTLALAVVPAPAP